MSCFGFGHINDVPNYIHDSSSEEDEEDDEEQFKKDTSYYFDAYYAGDYESYVLYTEKNCDIDCKITIPYNGNQSEIRNESFEELEDKILDQYISYSMMHTRMTFLNKPWTTNYNKDLLKEGIEIGQSTLFMAVLSRCPRMVQLLLDWGCDVNQFVFIGNDCYAPILHLALFYIENPSITIVQQLLNAGADVNQLDNKGQTVLQLASSKVEYLDIIRILLAHGARVNANDHYKKTSMHYVFKHRSLNRRCCICQPQNLENKCTNLVLKDLIIELFRHGAEVTVHDQNGRTPLHDAISNQACKHLIETLLDHGVEDDSIHQGKKTALNMEANKDKDNICYEVIKLLLIYGANYDDIFEECQSDTRDTLAWIVSCFKSAKKIVGLPDQVSKNFCIPSLCQDRLQKFEGNCAKELAAMKLKKLIGNITVLQFLRADKKFLAHLISRHKVNTLLKVIKNLHSQYPIYYPWLKRNWAIGQRFALILTKAATLFANAINPPLLLVLAEKIIIHLNYDEIKLLIRAVNDVKSSKRGEATSYVKTVKTVDEVKSNRIKEATNYAKVVFETSSSTPVIEKESWRCTVM